MSHAEKPQSKKKFWFAEGGGGALGPSASQRTAGKRLPAGRAGSGKDRGDKAQSSTAPRATRSGKQREEEEEYVVLIKNVEHDPAVIHEHALPSFMCLRKPPPSTSSNTFQLTCRNETHSAQVSFFGEASTLMQCFASPRPPNLATQGKDANADAAAAAAARKQVGTKRKRDADMQEEAKPQPEALQDAAAETAQPLFFSNLHEAATKLRARTYFGQKVLISAEVQADGSDGDLTLSQANLVCCDATVSKVVSQKGFKKLLDGVPGFNTAWRLRAQAFKVVFTSSRSLFAAKMLLDEFEADGGVRVALRVPEHLRSAFEEHVQKAADEQQFV